jgi:hypothetical protein
MSELDLAFNRPTEECLPDGGYSLSAAEAQTETKAAPFGR